MFIKTLSNGLVQSNVYIVGANKEAIVIDCGCAPEYILELANAQGLNIRYVVLTHGHFDHIYYIDALRERKNIPVCIHELEAGYLSDPLRNGLAHFPMDGDGTFLSADHLLKEGELLECGGLQFKIIHTPGHTKGGICIHVENCVFTGDTLFRSSYGRTDFPGGSMREITHSIQQKLYSLPDETVVYPGHGMSTTIGFEKKNNPYIREKL